MKTLLLLGLAMIQEQTLVASEHYLIETKDNHYMIETEDETKDKKIEDGKGE